MAQAPTLTLNMSVALKKLLLDDWELVTKKELYAPCPRSPNVHDILKQFCERYKKELPPSFAAELTEGLKSYFTKALSTVLLFTVERDDLLTLVQRHGGDPCAVLGAEHFLRLFVKLPEIMPVGDLTEDAREGLQAALNLLLSFLDNKKKLFFTKEYLAIGPDGFQVAPPAPEPQREDPAGAPAAGAGEGAGVGAGGAATAAATT